MPEKEKTNAFWNWLKNASTTIGTWLHRYAGGIFMEEKAGKSVVSIGRVSFAAVLGTLLWIWYRSVAYEESMQLPPSIMDVFYVLASYVFGSKVVAVIKDKWGNGKKS